MGIEPQLQHSVCISETCFSNYFSVALICACSTLVGKFYNVDYKRFSHRNSVPQRSHGLIHRLPITGVASFYHNMILNCIISLMYSIIYF